MMQTRKIAEPIFFIKKDVVIVDTKPVIADEPLDVVLIDDHSDESIEEIELNFAENQNEFETPEQFWEWIDKLGWKDKSALPAPRWRYGSRENKRPNLCNLNIASLQGLKEHFWRYFNELKKVFEEKGVFGSLERELQEYEKNQVFSHIIAKGQIYYATIKSEPYFCGALVSKNKSNDDFDDFLKHIK
jgi:hypothetical protein